MSMFGIVFPDPHRQERLALLLAIVAYDCEDEVKAEEWMQPIIDLRIRDAWVEKQPDGPPVLALYTRNGGGNREHFCQDGQGACIACDGERAAEHPAYLSDADDEFDSTYRTYRFAFPTDLRTDYKEALNEVAEDPRDMSAMWLQAINAIGGEAANR